MSMKYFKRLNEHYDKGIKHGLKGVDNPGLIYGSFRTAYKSGQAQGSRMRVLRDFKTKK